MPLVGETMTHNCQCIGEHDSVRDAARLLADQGVGAVPICGEDDRLKGMLTDRDITIKIVAEGKDPETTEVAALAAGTPIWVEADATIDRAMELMTENAVRRLPVIEDHRLVGIISQADIAAQSSNRESGDLVSAISAAPPNN